MARKKKEPLPAKSKVDTFCDAVQALAVQFPGISFCGGACEDTGVELETRLIGAGKRTEKSYLIQQMMLRINGVKNDK